MKTGEFWVVNESCYSFELATAAPVARNSDERITFPCSSLNFLYNGLNLMRFEEQPHVVMKIATTGLTQYRSDVAAV